MKATIKKVFKKVLDWLQKQYDAYLEERKWW